MSAFPLTYLDNWAVYGLYIEVLLSSIDAKLVLDYYGETSIATGSVGVRTSFFYYWSFWSLIECYSPAATSLFYFE